MQKSRQVGDLIACGFLVAIILYLTFQSTQFSSLTASHPYLMGFVKFGLLAPFGRLLAGRLFKSRRWEISKLIIPQALLWGLTGMWITAAFSLVSSGTTGLMTAGLWPQTTGFGLALSRSVWINLLGGYGFFMMFVHEVAERSVCGRLTGKPFSVSEIVLTLARENWFVPIFLTVIFFWIPAHTVTFMLPRAWQVLFAASLSVVLGMIKAVIAKPQGRTAG